MAFRKRTTACGGSVGRVRGWQGGLLFLLGSLAAGTGFAQPAPAVAEPPAASPAALIRIRLPLTGGTEILEQSLSAVRDRLLDEARAMRDPRRPILVLQIAPAPGAADGGVGTSFERAFALADLISSREMSAVKTVAWVPQSIRGHGVLLAIACEEIIMPADAEIGEAGADEPEGRAMRQAVVAAYREIAEARRTIPVALAIGMIDPEVEVLQVESEEGIEFLSSDQLAQFQQDRELIESKVLVTPGTLARFSGREGRQFGFVKFLAEDKQAVARALAIESDALVENDALLADWQPVLLEIRGPITRRSISELKTMLGEQLAAGSNWVGLRIDSPGGDLASGIDLANTLARLDTNSVRTVAYVPVEARGVAAVIALSCDQLVMHPEAKVGTADVGPPRDERPPPPPGPPGRQPPPRPQDLLGLPDLKQGQLEAAVRSIEDSLAPRVERSGSLLAAMVDPAVQLSQYRHQVSGEVAVMSAAEAAGRPDGDQWKRMAPIVPATERLLLSGDRAVELGLAWRVVESFDQLKQLYGIDEDPPLVEANWVLRVVTALASPGFAALLLLFGFAGIYIEIKTPGVGVGGFVAAVAFLLFFWSKYLDQTATWLEIVLFLSGIVFLLMEWLVLPGFGIFGLGGGILVIFSLVMASQTFILPQTPAQLSELRSSMTVVAAAAVGVLALGIATRRLLPETPLFRWLMLEPLAPEEKVLLEGREQIADYAHLVGRQGTAMTDLRPTGKARFGGELVDVVAEAEPIDRDCAVTVVAAQANRVTVRAC
jgi:membrane-bound ClpP family serine protease